MYEIFHIDSILVLGFTLKMKTRTKHLSRKKTSVRVQNIENNTQTLSVTIIQNRFVLEIYVFVNIELKGLFCSLCD